jgi:hypothetical protein
LVEFPKLRVRERGFLAWLLAKLHGVLETPPLLTREAGKSTFFVEKPKLPFVTSPLYVKRENRVTTQPTTNIQHPTTKAINNSQK